MAYAVKEIFLTLQGEGAHAGRTAVFCRFAGCNLWSGREADRADAQCRFCDTDFVGTDGTRGGSYATAEALAAAILAEWGDGGEHRYVVLTGGEPLLQADAALLDALHANGFAIALETNGTIEPPAGLDWICVSPKAGTELRLRSGHELKLVYPQPGARPEAFRAEVTLRGTPAADTGMIVDTGVLEQRLAELRRTLDHRFLNRINELGKPTLENLARYIWERVQPIGEVTRVTVHRDSCNESCSYFGPQA